MVVLLLFHRRNGVVDGGGGVREKLGVVVVVIEVVVVGGGGGGGIIVVGDGGDGGDGVGVVIFELMEEGDFGDREVGRRRGVMNRGWGSRKMELQDLGWRWGREVGGEEVVFFNFVRVHGREREKEW